MALKETFAFRQENLPIDLPDTLAKLDRETLRRGWTSAIVDVSEESLDSVFDKFLKILREKLR